jgi:hypothetical protein
MTQRPDKLPLLLAVGADAGVSHASMTADKDPRPLTNARRGLGLVPQSEVDKQTHIIDRHYSDAKFDQLTPAEKQMLWQLRNVDKTSEN